MTPSKFEKRKAGKADSDTEDFQGIECPFCGDIYDDLASHLRDCDLAPDDASIEDILPKKKKKKKKPGGKAGTSGKSTKEKQICPHCGKGFLRLGRHLNSCPKRPTEAKDK